MNQLPSSIEQYLAEAGFSATELLIMKHLLAEEALTLRQLAGKTGKSTGVLDQAMRKMSNKNIIRKEIINNSPKFVIASLNAIIQWVQEDMKEKRETLARKYQNFETFVNNLKIDRTRPEMKYYDGWEGLQQAYMKLLENKQEIVGFVPVTFAETDDPLRDFRVQYFRERRGRGIFMRVIAQNTPLGRRFECRDHFEYRKTLLVSDQEYPFTCEKLIAGGTIACIDYTKQRACLINHPELAETERAFFEKIWSETMCKQEGECKTPTEPGTPPAPIAVPLTTRTASHLREFFLSKSSLVTLGVFALVAAAMTYGLYRHNVKLNTERVQEQARSIAAAAAMRFDAADLDQLHTKEDMKKPAYEKVVKTLNQIRWEQNNVYYAYIHRPTDKADIWEFIADADSMERSYEYDTQGDGNIGPEDENVFPGRTFDLRNFPGWDETLKGEIYVDAEPYTDQWGTWISGGAPMYRDDESIAGIVGVDIEAAEIYRMAARNFAPLLYFLGFFLLFLVIRFSAANRQLAKELYKLLLEKKIIISLAVSAVLALVVTFVLQSYTSSLNLKRIQERAQSIAVTGQALLKPEEVAALEKEEDWKKPEWASVVNTLKDIRLMNEDILFVYILRKDPANPEKFVFVADSHSLNPYANMDDDPTNNLDLNGDRLIEQEGKDGLAWPGQEYENPFPEFFAAYDGPTVGDPDIDQWGSTISGYSPIKNSEGQTIGILGVDVKTEKLMELNHNSLQPIQYFVFFLILFFIFSISAINPKLVYSFVKFIQSNTFSHLLIIICFLGVIATYGVYKSTLKIMKEQIGERLMSIAATAAPGIRASDLDTLQKAEDMKTSEYQNIFEYLNQIRENNKQIVYVYILRPTHDPETWVFVADADSNYDLPYWVDDNENGIQEADETSVSPGWHYDITTGAVDINKAKEQPVYEKDFVYDQWGTYISAYAPIIDENGGSIAVLGLDMRISDVLNETKEKFRLALAYLGLLPLFILLILGIFRKWIRSAH